jgi:hypothetical protein
MGQTITEKILADKCGQKIVKAVISLAKTISRAGSMNSPAFTIFCPHLSANIFSVIVCPIVVFLLFRRLKQQK